jgi:hypothetical protein
MRLRKQELEKRKQSKSKKTDSLKDLLLRGPVMSDSKYALYKETRKRFGLWAKK